MINLCFTKIKLPLPSQSSTSPTTANPDDQSRQLPTNAAAPSILIKNFNTLYEYAFDSTTATKPLSHSLSSLSSSASEIAPAADFATAFASQRFFFSTPGRSNSIVESTTTTTTTTTLHSGTAKAGTLEPDRRAVFDNSVAVPTFSPDPYADFRRSMQEMVEAREFVMDVKKPNWEFLHELLLCYLALNPKSTHKFIIGAFADLLVNLMPSLPDSGVQLEADFVAGVREISRQCT